VLDGDPALPPPKGSRAPNFPAYVYFVQTAGCIKMPLGTEVGLDPSDIVLDGTQLPPLPKGGAKPPVFGPYLLWPNGCMDHVET